MRKIILTLFLVLTVTPVLSSLGIKVNVNTSSGSDGKHYQDGEYEDSFLYSCGSFSYDTDSVDVINVNWLEGKVEVVQKKGKSFSVTESGTGLSSSESLHYLIKDRTLYIQFAESGYDYTGKEEDKYLTLEIPSSVSLSISSLSASIVVTELDVKSLSISSLSGNGRFGELEADKNAYITTQSGNYSFSSLEADNVYFTSSSGNISVGEIDADNIYFTLSSGDVTLKRGDFDYGSISSSSGDKFLSNIECEELTLHSSSGKTEAQNVDVEGRLSLSGSSGDCSFLNLNVLKLCVVLSSGSFKAERIWAPELNVQASEGNVQLSLSSDTKGTISTTSGNIKLQSVQNDTQLLFQTDTGVLIAEGKARNVNFGTVSLKSGSHFLSIETSSGSLIVE